MDSKHRIRDRHRLYRQPLNDNRFAHSHTKIDSIQRDLKVSRLTATRDRGTLAHGGLFDQQKIGPNNQYVNVPPHRALAREQLT